MLDGILVEGLVNARTAIAELFRRLEPRPPLSVSDWADRHRVLSGKGAAEPGPWRTARTPYLREPMDALSVTSDVQEVVLWFGTQLGKSETCNNWIGYNIDTNPGPMLLVQPTLDLAKRFSKQRIAPLIAATPVLRDRVQPARARDSGNTLLEKDYEGGILVITGANSPAGLRSMPARDMMFDEIDAYPFVLVDEGDPMLIAENRQDTYAATGKRLKTSTCTVKGASRIEQAYETSDQRRYFVPCPHCGHMQVLRWANIKWTEREGPKGERILDVRYACGDPATSDGCGVLIEESHKTEMLERGEWRASAPASSVRGYWLSSLYSPLGWLSWAKIVAQFLDAQVAAAEGDLSLLQVWTNTRLAETWEVKGSGIKPHDVQQRAEDYALRSVPRGVLLITASVDVQGDRLEIKQLGWGRGEECWILDYTKLYGDPAEWTVWEHLDALLLTPLRNSFGIDMRVAAAAIDHGGHHSQQVETFTRARRGRHVIAIKGQSQPGKPVIGKPSDRDTDWRGKRVKRSARVWPVGSDTAKYVLYQRLTITTPGPGYIHTSKDLDDEYYRGLTAEQLVTRYVRGRPRSEWVLVKGRRNEPLDLWVYGYAAAAHLGMTRWVERDWDELARRVEPALFDPERQPAAATQEPREARASEVQTSVPEQTGTAVAPRRVPRALRPGGGFVGRWKK